MKRSSTAASLFAPLLCAVLVGCNQAARLEPEATARALDQSGGLSIGVYYDALKSGMKPNGLRDEGEPLIGKLPVEITALNPKTLQPSGEPQLFTTPDKDPLFVPLPAGLYRVRAASVQPFDAKYQWLETGVRSWLVRLDGRLTQTSFFPRVCRGSVITGPDELFRCDGKAFFAKPELPAFTLSAAAAAPVYECSHDSNAASLKVSVQPGFASSSGLVNVSLTSFITGLSFSGSQQLNVGSSGNFKLETRRTPPGNDSLTVSGTQGTSGYTASLPLTVTADVEGAPGDCFTRLEGSAKPFAPVYASPDGTVFASNYDGGSARGEIRRFAPGATVSGLSYTTPAVMGGASGILEIGSSASGAIYASEFSVANTSTTPAVSGRLLRLGATGWTPVPLPLQANEFPALIVTWNNLLLVSTSNPTYPPSNPSRLIEAGSGTTLFSTQSGERITNLRAVGSRLFVATKGSVGTYDSTVYEWQNGALNPRCTPSGAVINLVANAQGDLLISAENAIYQLAAGGTTCAPDARTWAANHLLVLGPSDRLFAANISSNGGDLLVEQVGSTAPLYPNQPLPSARQAVAADGRLWITTNGGFYRMTP
jgi:hypothetical protein